MWVLYHSRQAVSRRRLTRALGSTPHMRTSHWPRSRIHGKVVVVVVVVVLLVVVTVLIGLLTCGLAICLVVASTEKVVLLVVVAAGGVAGMRPGDKLMLST